MMLRWIVGNWLRQAARDKVYDSVSQVARESMERPGRPGNEEQPTAPEALPCRVLVVFAMGVEAGGLVDLLQDRVTTQGPTFVEHNGLLGSQRIALIETGVGRQLASRGVSDAVAVHAPEWVISAGFAGALHPDLKRGHILMASHLVDLSQRSLSVGLQLDAESLAQRRGLHTGRLVTVDAVVRTAAEKQQLAARSHAVACDMETLAVGEVCSREKVKFLSVRIISDDVDYELPPEISKLLDQDSLAGKLGAVTGAIFGRPSSVKDMWKLREEAIRASDRLARFLVGVISEL